MMVVLIDLTIAWWLPLRMGNSVCHRWDVGKDAALDAATVLRTSPDVTNVTGLKDEGQSVCMGRRWNVSRPWKYLIL